MSANKTRQAQALYWIGTVNEQHGEFTPPTNLPNNVVWLRGQKETGASGNVHWQLFAAFDKKVRLNGVKTTICNGHWEPTRSSAAEQYVFKEDTAIPGTRFELGSKKFNPAVSTDWVKLKDLAKLGELAKCLELSPEATIRCYSSLKHIARDFMEKPKDLDMTMNLWIYGPPGVGKSHWVREQYPDIYPKMCNKWWCGYQGQKNVLIDDLDLSHSCLGHHIKIWADKYSFINESKAHSSWIRPERIIVTSNYKPEDIWHDPVLAEAIKRRFYFIHIPMKRY